MSYPDHVLRITYDLTVVCASGYIDDQKREQKSLVYELSKGIDDNDLLFDASLSRTFISPSNEVLKCLYDRKEADYYGDGDSDDYKVDYEIALGEVIPRNKIVLRATAETADK